jgi:hypothetical protein
MEYAPQRTGQSSGQAYVQALHLDRGCMLLPDHKWQQKPSMQLNQES